MIDSDTKNNTPDERRVLTAHLREKIIQQVTESAQIQADLRQWYAAKLGKDVQQLDFDECPALLRVMQIIRLLREIQLEVDQDLEAA
jgi:hypothetical protein